MKHSTKVEIAYHVYARAFERAFGIAYAKHSNGARATVDASADSATIAANIAYVAAVRVAQDAAARAAYCRNAAAVARDLAPVCPFCHTTRLLSSRCVCRED